MNLLTRLGIAAAVSLPLLAGLATGASAADTMVITTKDGQIDVQLRPDLAPNHVKQIEALAQQGFYNDIVFHRVIDGFMAQTGDVKFGKEGGPSFDPSRAGTGGSDRPNLKAEFNREPHVRGTASMARSQSPDSANSQFFICFDDAPFLNRQYTVWGQVTEGMDNVDKIKRGEPVREPDKIVSMKVAADA